MATVLNLNQLTKHEQTSLRFAKTKELQSQHTNRHTIAAHLFLPRHTEPFLRQKSHFYQRCFGQ